jgi:cytochrome c oxidase subunit 2
MDTSFKLHPEQASTVAEKVDMLYFFLVGVSVFFTVLIALLILVFAIRYRRSAKVDRTHAHPNMMLEVVWIVVPLVIVSIIFFWSMRLYYDMSRIPEEGIEIQVVAKQWMWKFQHPQGRREIDTLHVPAGTVMKFKMISQDVIHSFFVPAFRIKQDVLPGRYSRTWFEATTPGEYHLFCAEYCGTSHSQMIGRVIVMSPADYQQWVSGSNPNESPLAMGERLYNELRCASCHGDANLGPTRGPSLVGIYNKQVPLEGGGTATADDDFLRAAILEPNKHIMAGFAHKDDSAENDASAKKAPPWSDMPSFKGQIGEDELNQLIAYIKNLKPGATSGGARER